MKLKSLLLFCLTACVLGVSAQEGDDRKHEISISPFVLIAGGVNVSYERLLNHDQSVGVDAFIVPDEFSQVAPYYRMYFGSKYSNGFFIEGFLPISNKDYYNYNSDRSINRTLIGAGFGVGAKWVLKRNIVIELSGGIGRMIGSFENYDTDFVTGKGKLGVGYRF